MPRPVYICEEIGILGLCHRFDVLQVGPPRKIEGTLPWHGRMDANKDLQDNEMLNMAWNVRKTPVEFGLLLCLATMDWTPDTFLQHACKKFSCVKKLVLWDMVATVMISCVRC